ncbi:MAG: FHA domain-containing protein [Phycisphaeraceae bacterium]|nr:FHA domain-containing protein [Phycisphaeraceae bacterium]
MEANLLMQLKDKAQKIIPVPNEVSVIGRQKNCDFRIPLESISRRHCEVHCDNEGVVLRDLGSRNGTLLNGTKISNAERMLQPGDEIRIGPIIFIIQIDGQPNQESLEASPLAPEETPSGTHVAIKEEGLGGDELGDELGDSGDLDISDLDDFDDLDDLDFDDI